MRTTNDLAGPGFERDLHPQSAGCPHSPAHADHAPVPDTSMAGMTTTQLPCLQTRSAMLRAGRTDAEIRSSLAGGRRTRLATGVYVATEPYLRLTPDDRYLVRVQAEAARSPRLVVSHLSAAALHGLPLVRARLARVHFTRPGDRGGIRTNGRWVHVGDLPESMRLTVGGIELTSLARTLVDLARNESAATSVTAADAALQMAMTTTDLIAAALDEATYRKGAPAAARAMNAVDGRSESPGESLLRLSLRGRGLPEPELQVEIYDEDGNFVARSDLAILPFGILIEFDGTKKYTRLLRPGEDVVDAVLREKRREERLTELGWLVIRVTWDDLRHPDRLAARILVAGRTRRPLVKAGIIRGSVVTRPAIRLGG